MFPIKINWYIIGIVLIAVVVVAFKIQSYRIDKYKIELNNAVTTKKIAHDVKEQVVFEESKRVEFKEKRGKADEIPFIDLPDGNYTISF
jgi:hypothetical protein